MGRTPQSLRSSDERTVWRKENVKKFFVWCGIAILLLQNGWGWIGGQTVSISDGNELLLSVIWQNISSCTSCGHSLSRLQHSTLQVPIRISKQPTDGGQYESSQLWSFVFSSLTLPLDSNGIHDTASFSFFLPHFHTVNCVLCVSLLPLSSLSRLNRK